MQKAGRVGAQYASRHRRRTERDTTDRELLEAAGRAAGLPYPKWNEALNYMMIGLGADTKEWNPLDDDGDWQEAMNG